ncbi:phosphoenolpyruvate--protein phosphotransferase [Cellulomonas hominis]|uniref:phosphoenolpyruvate--protein phosphotransferase n=1 Tax=Cellulomonas hominis TaxID=156981 RepID=UPI001B92318A|nr:putative PEP-binding protein [Cellulomonas hominis]VTR75887.1 Phosphoenolpyruvate-protein phosphotransferase [Cellulomonas hominis]
MSLAVETTADAVLRGIGVGRGVALAPVALVAPPPDVPADEPAPLDPVAAEARVRAVLADVGADLRTRSAATENPDLRQMLDAAATMACDPALAAEAARLVHSGVGPAGAVDRAVEGFAAVFAAAGGDLAERATDLRSVRHRAVARLLGVPEPGLAPLDGPAVVVADDLSPADTAALDLTRVAAIVTERGGPTSHTAIVAGQLGLPCVVRVTGATTLAAGTPVLVDAAAGTVEVDPPSSAVDRVVRRAENERVIAGSTGPGSTADDHRVPLLANVGTPTDARAAADGTEGVGLFRTEVLFLDARTEPTLDEQTAAYAEVIDAYAGRKVVVRTLDAGADKPLAFAHQTVEENPALGVRGYRLVRSLPGIVERQLQALGAAVAALPDARRDDVWVMAPMIATAAEARDFAAAARAAGIRKVGVMVEVPAAALRAEAILAEVDFVSLGTNDLAQYTMAADRLRGELADLLDPWQPAVLTLVRATARAGAATGKPVGVCGESANDPLMALVLAGLGITSLSMAAGRVPAVRYALRAHTLEECRAMAEAAVGAPDARSAREAVRAALRPEVARVLLGES